MRTQPTKLKGVPVVADQRFVMPLCPACGTGSFLAGVLGIYFTPQNILDFLEGKPTANRDSIIGNPPFGMERHNDSS